MFLKNYQVKVLDALNEFYTVAAEERELARDTKINNPRLYIGWLKVTFEKLRLRLKDDPRNGLNEDYPRLVIKVPTGGGKTLLAVNAIRQYQNKFAKKRYGLVVWIIPTETIYSQTIKCLRDKSHPYRQFLDQASGGNTIILEKGQKLYRNDLENNLVVLFLMIQSVSRTNGKEGLKVFQDSGGFDEFFPPDHRYDLHKQILEQVPNVDYFASAGTHILPTIKTSLANAIRISRPFIIIDEIHKVYSDLAKQTIDGLNPEMVLGLTATPKPEMNILVKVTGMELKQEEMIKLDMHIYEPNDSVNDDYKSMIRNIVAHRNKLENIAINEKVNTGKYVRPIALMQVERTGKDQRGQGFVHSLDVKELLIELGINADEIAIKTSSQNDIENINLLSSDCPIRYIITKEALKEGWDCPFAYILGIIPNVNSSTSVTQLVGRILRQPYAKKFGVKDLDESYVYYCKGDNRKILTQITNGFKNEGLEDLIANTKFTSEINEKKEKTIKIKDEFSNNHYGSLFLPVWLMLDEEGKKRKFSYAMDIKSNLDFKNVKLNKDKIDAIKLSLIDENKRSSEFVLTITDENKTTVTNNSSTIENYDKIDLIYLTRRMTEVIENPFMAMRKSNEWLEQLKAEIENDLLNKNFTFLVLELLKFAEIEKHILEEEVFHRLLEENKLCLGVSQDTDGFMVPREDVIVESEFRNNFKSYLFDDIDIENLNDLEKSVAKELDNKSKILWWFRNKVNKNWYSIQGWNRNKIYPDFVAAKKDDDGNVKIVYILESKGEHLSGNQDTLYKDKIFRLFTKLNQEKKIKDYSESVINANSDKMYKLNKEFEAYLLEQGNETSTINTLFN